MLIMNPVRSCGRRAPLEVLGRKNHQIFSASPYPNGARNNTMSKKYYNKNCDGLLTGRVCKILMQIDITRTNRAGCKVNYTSAPYF